VQGLLHGSGLSIDKQLHHSSLDKVGSFFGQEVVGLPVDTPHARKDVAVDSDQLGHVGLGVPICDRQPFAAMTQGE